MTRTAMSPALLEIRPATLADAVPLALLMRVTFRDAFGEAWGNGQVLFDYLEHTFAVAKIASSLAKPNNFFAMALKDGMPVGYAKLKYVSPYQDLADPKAGQLQKIYLLPEYIGQGIGEALQQAVFDALLAKGGRTVWLAVWKGNQAGIRFYQRHGFRAEYDYQYDFHGTRFEYDVMVKRFL